MLKTSENIESITWSRKDVVRVASDNKAECNGKCIDGNEVDDGEIGDNQVGKKV